MLNQLTVSEPQNWRRRYQFRNLISGHASPYTEEKYGGYGQLLETLLREPGEEWERFVVLEGKFPTAEQLAKVISNEMQEGMV